MFSLVSRRVSVILLGAFAAFAVLPLSAESNQKPSRLIVANLKGTTGPVDHFFDFSVGSDYPGTLIRRDSQAQLKMVVDELVHRPDNTLY